MTNIPSRESWGDISNPDVLSAFNMFFGKSNLEVQKDLDINLYERCVDLNWMPLEAFQYYIFSLKIFIERADVDEWDKGTVACMLFDIIVDKTKKEPEFTLDVYKNLRPLLLHISNNQEQYDPQGDFDCFKSNLNWLDSIVGSVPRTNISKKL